jgi:hypothetical protein
MFTSIQESSEEYRPIQNPNCDCEKRFHDPIYGGNKDFAGWRLVGFPGVQSVFTPADMKSKEVFTRTIVIGIQGRGTMHHAEGMNRGNRKG